MTYFPRLFKIGDFSVCFSVGLLSIFTVLKLFAIISTPCCIYDLRFATYIIEWGGTAVTDDEIIELYHLRSESAISETDRKHGTFCRRLAMNILTSREDVEECVSDTWLAAWNSMPPDRPSSLRAFLGRITRNLSISRFRRNHAAKRYAGMEILLSELEECIPDGAAEVEIERRLLSDIISRWLDSLSDVDRVMFVRRYWYGDSVKELAYLYGETQNQTAKRMQRLRQNLREVLEKEGIEI